MSRRHVGVGMWVTLVVLTGCRDDFNTSDDGETSAATSTGESGDGDGDCADGELSCSEQCFDPLTSDEHCGECDNTCQVSGPIGGELGGCDAGECKPRLVCAPPAVASCSEICLINAGSGSTCADCTGTGVYAMEIPDAMCATAQAGPDAILHGAEVCDTQVMIPVGSALFCCCT